MTCLNFVCPKCHKQNFKASTIKPSGKMLYRCLDCGYRSTFSKKQTCSYENCDRPICAKGLCKKHYMIMWHGKKKAKKQTCSYKNCDRPICAKGMCRKHYMIMWHGKKKAKSKQR